MKVVLSIVGSDSSGGAGIQFLEFFGEIGITSLKDDTFKKAFLN